ncbi:MAG: hypothetical protein QJR14_07395 [Bacillota bacterium]|nr:hypothetical protein [Bacillota bacterium]
MEKERAPVSAEEITALVKQLPSVIGARVVVNEWGGIEEIHVLATDERSPKALVRDVQSALAARWGLMVDYRKVSIAQQAVPRAPSHIRLAVASLQATTDLLKDVIRVEVSLEEQAPAATLWPLDPPGKLAGPFRGVAEGVHSGRGMLRVGAEAVLAALNQAVDPQVRFFLEEAGEGGIAGRRLILVSVLLRTSRVEEPLVGASLLAGDPVRAAVNAALDACNRRLGRVYAGRYRSPNAPHYTPAEAMVELSRRQLREAAAARLAAEEARPGAATSPATPPSSSRSGGEASGAEKGKRGGGGGGR